MNDSGLCPFACQQAEGGGARLINMAFRKQDRLGLVWLLKASQFINNDENRWWWFKDGPQIIKWLEAAPYAKSCCPWPDRMAYLEQISPMLACWHWLLLDFWAWFKLLVISLYQWFSTFFISRHAADKVLKLSRSSISFWIQRHTTVLVGWGGAHILQWVPMALLTLP